MLQAVAAPAPLPPYLGRQTGLPLPGQRAYAPRGAARDLMLCRDPLVLIEGPAGTGKSRAALEKLHLALCKYPGARGLVVRKTRESLSESTLVTYEEKVLPDGSPIKAGPDRHNRQRYDYPNGSELVVGGMDKPSKIMSTEYDIILALEATELTEADAEALDTRLRNGVMPYQQLIFDCNPGPPTHWLNQWANTGRATRLRSRHADNPTVTPAYLARLARLTGVRKKRLALGLWAAADGLIYEDYDPLVHLIDRLPLPAAWPRYRVIDFGYTNPFVCQWWAVDGDGRAYRYREMYGTGRLVEDWAKDILALSGDEVYVSTLADHDAEDRATLARYGIATDPAPKEVSPGIQAVAARLRPAGDGRPRLFLLRDSLVTRDARLSEAHKPACTEEEFDGYIWEPTADGKPNKEAPHKADDHGLDALRYLIYALDENGPLVRYGPGEGPYG